MENLIVVSKLKKHMKEQQGLSTSSNFTEPLNKNILEAIDHAANKAKSQGRKTIMGRDFSLYIDSPKIDSVLVVASKIKNHIKDVHGLSTSKQVMEQLTVQVQEICTKAAVSAKEAKRKTVMDRDIH